MNWEFEISDEVFDTRVKCNGVVTLRKYEENEIGGANFYHVTHRDDNGTWSSEYVHARWLESGHKNAKKIESFGGK